MHERVFTVSSDTCTNHNAIDTQMSRALYLHFLSCIEIERGRGEAFSQIRQQNPVAETIYSYIVLLTANEGKYFN